jgi:hypothetical protein
MTTFRSLQVRDCPGILWAFYREYDGSALASFEGDLSELHLNELSGCSFDETNSLKRQTLEPLMDFVVVSIHSQNVNTLKKLFAKQDVLGTNGSIIHTQIEVGGEPLFIACDNFHDDCTVVSTSVSEAFLKQLKERGILRGYSEV